MFYFFRKLLSFALLSFSLLIIAIAAIYYFLSPKLPDTHVLKETQFQVPLRIFSAESKLIAEFGEKRRIPLSYKDIPPHLVQAILSSEDDRFFEHPGVDYHGILRAIYSLAATGVKAQGGSTITMQVARNFFLSREKTYIRKLNEIILALQIEQQLTKEEILTLYLNKIYLGNRAYGVGAAAKVYYGKPLAELTLPQFAMIAGLPKAPSTFNPIVNPERAQLRRDYVLRRMWQVGHITQQAYQTAIQAPITASYHSRNVEVYAPYIAEMVRTQLIEQYGDEAYNKGLNVYTTIRAKHQQAANTALQSALIAYDKRHGYRGAKNSSVIEATMKDEDFEQLLSNFDNIGPLHPGIVVSIEPEQAFIYVKNNELVELSLDSLKWARKQLSTNRRGKAITKISDVLSTGDIIHLHQDNDGLWQLAQLPEVEGAIVSVSPYDGAVTALNGGFEYFQNKFNRVTQSRRQPGSGFKPFIYSAALEKGYTAASIINDAPVVFDDPSVENVWRPENYSGKFFGPTRLRVALTNSRNLVSIRILRDISPEYVIDYSKKFGFDTTQMPKSLSLALGSGSAAPWDMARAYSSLANGGYRIEPYIIQRIEDASGNVIMQANPATVCETCLITQEADLTQATKSAERIMTPQNNYIMNSLLRDVVRYGTGRKAMKLGRNDLAGKTGTTNDQVDAWFNGFHPELVAISWVGFDSPKTLGRYETGGRAALPMWIDFMEAALSDLPDEPLQQPVDMITVKIDPDTGLLAGSDTQKPISETFRAQYVPTEISPPSDVGQGSLEQELTPEEDLF
ncbi:MAG: PBP1A family penicillin-binding protein [Methylococcaceae bacterium]|nr:PBP1A family penicillin-binding protein [Methylococcaceae bacterium]